MRISIALFILTFISSPFLTAQQQDLAKIAFGEYLGMNALFKDDKVYGYTVFTKTKELDQETNEFEILLLDKNLNKVANARFEGSNTILGFSSHFNYKDDLLITSRLKEGGGLFQKRNDLVPKIRKVDFSTKSVVDFEYKSLERGEYVLKEPAVTDEEVENRKAYEEIEFGNYTGSSYHILDDESRLGIEYIQGGKKNKFYPESFMIYYHDKNLNKLWEYKPDIKKGKKRLFYFYNFIDECEEYIYLNKSKIRKGLGTYYIGDNSVVMLSKSSGEKVFEESIHTHKEFKLEQNGVMQRGVQEKFNEIGYNYYSDGTFPVFKSYFKYTINTENDIESSWKLMEYSDFQEQIPEMNRQGKIDRYRLAPLSSFHSTNHKNYMFLSEFDKSLILQRLVNRNFYFLELSNDFEITKVHKIENAKSKGYTSRYLYMQDLNQEGDFVFFYIINSEEEGSKKSEWYLGINTFVDGEFKNDELQLSSDSYDLSPYVAKEGYIMLHEYDKENSVNTVRLERLNY